MARTEVNANDLVINSGELQTLTVMAAGATGADGFTIKNVARDSDLVITIQNSGATTGKFTIKAGDSVNSVLGDITVELTAGQTKAFKLDGARFRRSGGKYDIDAGVTGILGARQ
jgi:hypothetical protein